MNLFSLGLLVEDERALSQALKIALKKLNIVVEGVSTLKQAQHWMKTQIPELIILDRYLPDGDGFEFCQQLRQQGFQGTILMLTASGSTSDRVFGLNLGADDYLAKPFSWEELEARLRALARRKTWNPPSSGTQQLWATDDKQLKILGPKGWVQLTPLEYKLASHLIHHAQTIISRDELLKKVWGFLLLPKTRTVDHFLGRLRKYFELNPEQPVHFITIRGAGYQFRSHTPASTHSSNPS